MWEVLNYIILPYNTTVFQPLFILKIFDLPENFDYKVIKLTNKLIKIIKYLYTSLQVYKYTSIQATGYCRFIPIAEYTAISLMVVLEQSGKVKYVRERLLGIAIF